MACVRLWCIVYIWMECGLKDCARVSFWRDEKTMFVGPCWSVQQTGREVGGASGLRGSSKHLFALHAPLGRMIWCLHGRELCTSACARQTYATLAIGSMPAPIPAIWMAARHACISLPACADIYYQVHILQYTFYSVSMLCRTACDRQVYYLQRCAHT